MREAPALRVSTWIAFGLARVIRVKDGATDTISGAPPTGQLNLSGRRLPPSGRHPPLSAPPPKSCPSRQKPPPGNPTPGHWFGRSVPQRAGPRSEEHTSELQSLRHL